MLFYLACAAWKKELEYILNIANMASRKVPFKSMQNVRLRRSCVAFLSEEQTLSYRSKALLFSFHPAAFRIFFFDLTLYKEWQIASLKALWMQQYPDVPRACETLWTWTNTRVRWLERVKWLDWTASVSPRGKSSVLWCVISWLSGEVCVGVCLCVSHMGPLYWRPGCIELISVWLLVASSAEGLGRCHQDWWSP